MSKEIIKLTKKEKEEILVKTQHYPADIQFTERYYLYCNNINSVPTCPFCKLKKLKWRGSFKYAKTCADNECQVKQRKKTNILTFGTEHALQNKDILNKAYKTNLERHGVIHASDSDKFKEKAKQTCIKKYGVEYASQNSDFKEKVKKTSIRKYGSTNVLKNREIQNKIKKTNLQKYGVENPSQSEAIKNKKKETLQKNGHATVLSNGMTVTEYAKTYGKNNATALILYHKYGEESCSDFLKSNTNFKSSLENYIELNWGLKFFNKSPNGKFNNKLYRADFKITNTSYLDVDGLYWHSEKIKSKTYHIAKREWYESQGLQLYQIRDNEISEKENILKSMLFKASHVKVRASDCLFKQVKYLEAKTFLQNNHLQGSTTSIFYGLYYNDKLVCLMGVKKNFKKEYELSRFCSLLDYTIHGGFSRLLKNVTKLLTIKTLYSWCDLRYSQGKIYESNNFIKIKETLGWCWTDGHNTFHRLKYSKNIEGYSKGLYKIYDAGQRLYKLEVE